MKKCLFFLASVFAFQIAIAQTNPDDTVVTYPSFPAKKRKESGRGKGDIGKKEKGVYRHDHSGRQLYAN